MNLENRVLCMIRINVKLLVNNGKAKVDYFQVESEESDIELTGYVDLIERDYNLAANVQPSISDTIPLGNLFSWWWFWLVLEYGLLIRCFLAVKLLDPYLIMLLRLLLLLRGPWSEPSNRKTRWS